MKYSEPIHSPRLSEVCLGRQDPVSTEESPDDGAGPARVPGVVTSLLQSVHNLPSQPVLVLHHHRADTEQIIAGLTDIWTHLSW